MIEETERSGMLQALQETFTTAPGIPQTTKAKRNTSAALSPAKLSAAATAGRLQVHGTLGSGMHTSPSMHRTNFSSPEVVLREPLEQDFVMNRRLANQINARNKEEAARENRTRIQEEKKKKLDAEIKKKTDDIKTREKAQGEVLNAKSEIWAAEKEKRATVAENAF